MNAPERFSLSQTRFIRAPLEKVYEAFTTQAGLASWMGSRGTSLQSVAADPRVDGAWRVEMVAPYMELIPSYIKNGDLELTILFLFI